MTMDTQTPNQPSKNPALKAVLFAEAAAEAAELNSQPAATSAKKTNMAKAVAFLQAFSFKEETNLVSELTDSQNTALHQLKSLLLTSPASAPAVETVKTAPLESPDIAPAEETPKTAPLESPACALAEETPKAPPLDVPVDSEALKTPVDVDEDGAKTVEAIAETVVPVETVKREEDVQPKPLKKEEIEKMVIWGVPILGDERSDTVLLKFLRARDFKVNEALEMIKSALKWREEFGVEDLLEEELGVPELEKVVFMHGVDRDGHPVCYNVYGELLGKEVYELAFADEDKRRRFLRWRIQFLEKGIRNLLDFMPRGVSSMVQVIDLKNSVGLGKKELRQALALLQDNYPEFAAKQIFINVPWWYLAFNRIISPFFTQRTKSKFVFAGPSKSAETLFKYIAPEQVPVQYGGLSKENDPDFTIADAVTEIAVKPSSKQVVEIPVDKECLLVWELRVLGWDVSYGAQFVPNAENGYTVVIQRARKMAATEEPVLKDSYKIREAGKVVITVENSSSKKKHLLYRCKTKSSLGKN